MTSFLSVAVVGFQNAGKSTVVNALLQGEYTAASSAECTRKVFRFRLHESSATREDTTSFDTARSINSQICTGNQDQSANRNEICFPIRVREDICNETLPGFQMEIVDLPGLGNIVSTSSSAGDTGCVATDFIENNVGTLACILVVLDVNLCDADTRQKNKDLLSRLCEVLGEEGHSRCLVIGNKADHLKDAGKQEVIQCMTADVKQILGPEASFEVISAKEILYYRYAQELTLATFESMYLEKLDEMGKTMFEKLDWKSHTTKGIGLRSLHAKLTNQSNYKMALSLDGSNFDAFLGTLRSKIGTLDAQRSVLSILLDKRLDSLHWDANGMWINKIVSVSAEFKRIGVIDWHTGVQKTYERLFHRHINKATVSFEMDFNHSTFAEQTHAILEAWANREEWEDRSIFFPHAHKLLRDVVEKYLGVIASKFREWIKNRTSTETQTQASPPIPAKSSTRVSGRKRKVSFKIAVPEKISPAVVDLSLSPCRLFDDADSSSTLNNWTDMTCRDWECIVRSIADDVPFFAVYFTSYVPFFRDALKSCETSWGKDDDTIITAVSPNNADMRKDPSHWGYLVWKYIDYETKNPSE